MYRKLIQRSGPGIPGLLKQLGYKVIKSPPDLIHLIHPDSQTEYHGPLVQTSAQAVVQHPVPMPGSAMAYLGESLYNYGHLRHHRVIWEEGVARLGDYEVILDDWEEALPQLLLLLCSDLAMNKNLRPTTVWGKVQKALKNG